MKKKKKWNFQKLVEDISEKIVKNDSHVWTPPSKISYNSINTNSWFDIKHYNSKRPLVQVKPTGIKYKFPKSLHKCIKVDLILNSKQKFILDNWFNAYTLMYNETVSYIKNYKKQNKKFITDFKAVRKSMSKIKNQIVDDSWKIHNTNKKLHSLYMNDKSTIRTHIIDLAINKACSNFKSAINNKLAGNIKSFNIRHLKFNRKNKVITIEKCFFSKGTICGKTLGNISAYYDGNPFNLDDVPNIYKCDCLLKHDTQIDRYYLYVPTILTPKLNSNSKEFISLDPGIRTFLTGISEDEVVKIGNNVGEVLTEKFNKLEKLNKITNLWKRKKKVAYTMMKINNIIDDMHWKTIKWITSRYRNVLIGNLSTKNIISKDSIYDGKYKKIIQSIKLYEFRTRLEYKCQLNKINYKMVNEYYTSKMCSKCGNINENLGSKKLYNCIKCKNKIDRDVNGARNIYHKRN